MSDWLFDNLGEDIAFAEDLDFPALHFDVTATVAAVEDFISPDHSDNPPVAIVPKLTGTNCQHAAALRFLLGGVGKEDTAGRLFLRLQGFHDHTIIQGPNLNVYFFFLCHDRIPRSEKGISPFCLCLHIHAAHATHSHAAHAAHSSHATAHSSHATMVLVVVHLFLVLLGNVGHQRLGRQE